MKKSMFPTLLLLLAVAACGVSAAQGEKQAAHAADWRAQLDHELPLLGHRNWILIVDSAYPLQTSPGLERIETGEGLPEAAKCPQSCRPVNSGSPRISEAATTYKFLVLKTNETVPYSSVVVWLNCKYWSDDAETRLRAAMKHPMKASQ